MSYLFKTLIALTILSGSTTGFAKDKPAGASATPTFTRVVAYYYNRGQWPDQPSLSTDLKVIGEPYPEGGKELTQTDIARLRTAMKSTKVIPTGTPGFYPQHAFILYNGDQIVGSIEVCLSCIKAKQFIPGAARTDKNLDWSLVAHILWEAGLPLTANGNSADDYDRAFAAATAPRN